jgi:putative ABC transport system permease protein
VSESIYYLPLPNLILAVSLTLIVALIYVRWSLNVKHLLYAIVRMVLQLFIVGFALVYIFAQNHPIVILLILAFMILVASWIALGPLKQQRRELYHKSLLAIFIGGGLTLVVIIGGVIRLDPWYEPRYLIPLAGMTFSNAMNAVSLAAERFHAEMNRGVAYRQARGTALQTALLPTLNSLFAVGLVALPGVMTGQILSGISPLIAVRYQMMVLSMVLAAAGLSAALYLFLVKTRHEPQ